MIITRTFVNRRFRGSVDFDTFYLLAIVPCRGKNAIMMLAPKDITRDKFFKLQCGNRSAWYNSIDDLLDAAREYYGISRFRCWWYRHRYFKLIGRK